MAAGSAESGLTPSDPARPSRWSRRLALIVAVAVAASFGGSLYFVYGPRGVPTPAQPPQSPPPDGGNTSPREVARLGEGSVLLDFPLMTIYSAPDLKVHGFGTTAELYWSSSSTGPSTNITFEWSHATGTSLPVHFVFDPGGPHPYFIAGPEDGFVYLAAGECSFPCLSQSEDFLTWMIGAQDAYFVVWRMDYSVHEMQAMRNHVNETWLQVKYSFSPRVGGTESLPAANATVAGPADLLPIGDPVTLSYGRGLSWRYNVSIRQFPLPDAPFRHSLPLVVFNAGSAGNLTAILSSSFAWGPAQDYRLGLSGTNGVNVTMQFYLDDRFGALLVRYVS